MQHAQRLVHLDLKGAPPRASYLKAVFPWMKRWGATGLCIEWEDMLPFAGPLRAARAPGAYRPADVKAILAAARRAGLSVVPLVQTFGHLEFLLKHPAFAALREKPDDPWTLCPTHPASVPTMLALVNQVLALHPGIKTIHLGGDEVWTLGSCPRCKAYVQQHGKAALYLAHIRPIVEHLRRRGVRALLWDDMFRHWAPAELRELATLADAVVWNYAPDVDTSFPETMWRAYRRAGVRLWGASAFKGSGGEDIIWPWTEERTRNHEGWARRAAKTPLQGVILTGWSRHSHFYALCETLPAGLPSLALGLEVLRAGHYDDAMRRRVFTRLGLGDMPFMHRRFEDMLAIPEGRFPGARVFRLIGKLQAARQMMANCEDRIRTSFPQNNGGRVQPYWIAQVARNGRLAAATAQEAGRELEAPLRRILFDADVEEFMRTKVRDVVARARAAARAADRLRKRRAP